MLTSTRIHDPPRNMNRPYQLSPIRALMDPDTVSPRVFVSFWGDQHFDITCSPPRPETLRPVTTGWNFVIVGYCNEEDLIPEDVNARAVVRAKKEGGNGAIEKTAKPTSAGTEPGKTVRYPVGFSSNGKNHRAYAVVANYPGAALPLAVIRTSLSWNSGSITWLPLYDTCGNSEDGRLRRFEYALYLLSTQFFKSMDKKVEQFYKPYKDGIKLPTLEEIFLPVRRLHGFRLHNIQLMHNRVQQTFCQHMNMLEDTFRMCRVKQIEDHHVKLFNDDVSHFESVDELMEHIERLSLSLQDGSLSDGDSRKSRSEVDRLLAVLDGRCHVGKRELLKHQIAIFNQMARG